MKYFIITKSKVHHEVNDSQYQAVLSAKQDQWLSVNGNMFKRSDVSEILTEEKYYETFPNKKRYEPLYAPNRELEAQKGISTQPTRKRALEGLIRGLRGYLETTHTPNPTMLTKLEKMQRLYDSLPEDEPVVPQDNTELVKRVFSI